MIRMLSVVFCLLSLALFAGEYADEYKVSLLDVESFIDAQCGITAINDKGQVLGVYYEYQPHNKNRIFIFDPKTGLTFIESKDQQWIYPLTMNNAGQVLGHGPDSKPFIWSKVLGIRWLDVLDGTQIYATDLNDLGQIIGGYTPIGSNEGARPYIWDYGT